MIIASVLFASSSLLAATWLVKPDGSGDYATIQQAVDAAADGDSIFLSNGVFAGAGNREIHWSNKQLVVTSQSGNRGACILDCQGLGRGFILQLVYSGSVISCLTIRNGSAVGGGGLFINGCSPQLKDLTVENCSAESGGGMVLAYSSSSVSGCTVTGCSAQNAGGGLYVLSGACQFENLRVGGNQAELGGGIYFDYGSPILSWSLIAGNTAVYGPAIYGYYSTVVMGNCTIVDNDGTYTISAGSGSWQIANTIVSLNSGQAIFGSVSTLSCSDLWGNSGDWVGGIAGQLGINGNISLDPGFCNPAADNWGIDSGSPCAPENSGGCGLIGALGVGCGPTSVQETSWGKIKTLFR
jgi:hypothetical protein